MNTIDEFANFLMGNTEPESKVDIMKRYNVRVYFECGLVYSGDIEASNYYDAYQKTKAYLYPMGTMLHRVYNVRQYKTNGKIGKRTRGFMG